MNLSYRHILAAAMIAVGGTMTAQTLNSAYFTDEYTFRHTMNPAYGNEDNYVSVPALGNINVKMQGNYGLGDILFDNPTPGGKRLTTVMHPDISVSDALGGLGTGNNRVLADVNMTVLSAGFKAFGGYNTVELNTRVNVGTSLPYGLFEFAKNIGNNNYDIGDININTQAFAELAFGHSRQINEKLRVGAKLKFLFGAGRADLQMKDMKAELASDKKWIVSGQAEANVSMSGFTYVSEMKDYESEGAGQYEAVDDIDIDGAGLAGFGMAVDLGGVYKINDDWTVSASLIDLGFISWSSNARAVNAADKFEFDGFHDVAVSSSKGDKLDDISDGYADQITDFINLKDQGDTGGRTTGIGATLNFGAEYTLPVYRKVKFGALSTTRIRGAYSWTEGRISANYTPLKWLDGGVNFAVNSFAASMGWVLNIHPKGYNFFIGMDHILGKTTKGVCVPLSSNAHVALGMNITW